MSLHKSVLVQEVLNALNIESNKNYIDATFGQGGHSREILKLNAPKGKVLAIDADENSRPLGEKLSKEFNNRLLFFTGNFLQVDEFIEKTEIKNWHGVLADLGWSMDQFKKGKRGFSFNEDSFLDMRYSQNSSLTAYDIVNKYPEKDLAKLFWEYGEERWSKRIARKIVEYRDKQKIEKSNELADIIRNAIPKRFHSKRIDPATRVFQALRIEVNQELAVLEEFLDKIITLLDEKARIVIISFHSLEDRIVKHKFKQWQRDELGQILTKKPIMASEIELAENPASRSAKLRVFQKF